MSDDLFDRVVRSATMNLDHWRDGTGLDLDAIRAARGDTLKQIESFLISRGINHPRDVEAVAQLRRSIARPALKQALKNGSPEIRAAVLGYAPDLIKSEVRTNTLVKLIAECDAYDGLDSTLSQIESHHPAAVIEAMLDRIASTAGVAPVHFAAMLLFVHGKASEPFDWDHRPFVLRFNTTDLAERRTAIAELCERIGIEPQRWVDAVR